MKFNVLYNFISPVTGRILCDANKVLIGDINGIALPSATIPIGILPNLTEGHLWVGDATNRPIEVLDDYVSGPSFSLSNNVATWDGVTGRLIQDSFIPIDELIAGAAAAEFSAAIAEAAAKEAVAAAAVATAVAAFLLGTNALFKRGGKGTAGTTGVAGPPGAASNSGLATLFINANIDINSGRIENLAPSPLADYDAVNAKWVWDLLNDNVEIIWG